MCASLGLGNSIHRWRHGWSTHIRQLKTERQRESVWTRKRKGKKNPFFSMTWAGGRCKLEGTGDWKRLALVVKHWGLGEFSWMRVARKGSKTISLKHNQTFWLGTFSWARVLFLLARWQDFHQQSKEGLGLQMLLLHLPEQFRVTGWLESVSATLSERQGTSWTGQ